MDLLTRRRIMMSLNSVQPEPDYPYRYFTIKNLDPSGVIIWYLPDNVITNGQYRINKGEWQSITPEYGSWQVSLQNQNDIIELRSESTSLNYSHIYFNMLAEVYGNILSLFYGANFLNYSAFPSGTHHCDGLFSVDDIQYDLPISVPFSVEHLILPNTVGNYSYSGMFAYCSMIEAGPVLPATILAEGCYRDMFSYCTNLATAPDLPALTLVTDCYKQMFYGCTRLNSIKAMFTTNPDSGGSPYPYTDHWVSGVASTGTFTKNANATWTLAGNSGIPTNWTVQTE